MEKGRVGPHLHTALFLFNSSKIQNKGESEMDKLTQRQIIGHFFKTLAQNTGAGWVNLVSNYFESDQASEEYAWLGQSPMMREWVGGRNAKGLSESSLTIINKHYEATIDILIRHLRRDKSGQALIRIAEMARRSNAHWASLLTTLILAGPSATCYDGQYFFDTDHSEGSSGSQSNDISVDISEEPQATTGTVTAPSVEDMQWAIIRGILAIVGFVDNQGEPMNEDAINFAVMVPLTLYPAAMQAVNVPVQASSAQLALKTIPSEFDIKVVPNARIGTDWTDSFAVFRTDSALKSFIRQEEQAVQLKVKDENSEYAIDNDACQYAIDSWRNVGYGYWQNACYVTMT